jgi:hypothetical protein
MVVLSWVLAAMAPGWAWAQADDENPGYEELYDEPYSINRLFIGFQPLYGELFATNVNAGFGFDVSYFHTTKFDVKFQLRKTYGRQFFDMARSAAADNSTVDNDTEVFNYFELGGTYHIVDKEINSTTKMVKYKAADKSTRFAAKIPEQARVPAKVRQIIGARTGVIFWNSTTDISRALVAQGLTPSSLPSTSNAAIVLPATYQDQDNVTRAMNIYSNVYSTALYLGGSLTRIRNVAYSFDGFDNAADDGLVTYFLDVLYAPSYRLDDIRYAGDTYSTEALSVRNVGFRLGVDGKFNRKWGWGYGAEVGYRPGLTERNFYTQVRVSVPVFGTKLRRKPD